MVTRDSAGFEVSTIIVSVAWTMAVLITIFLLVDYVVYSPPVLKSGRLQKFQGITRRQLMRLVTPTTDPGLGIPFYEKHYSVYRFKSTYIEDIRKGLSQGTHYLRTLVPTEYLKRLLNKLSLWLSPISFSMGDCSLLFVTYEEDTGMDTDRVSAAAFDTCCGAFGSCAI